MSDAETPLPLPLLEDDALDLLDDFLEERAGPDALDLIGAHGFLVALAVAPRDVEAAAWVAELFHGTPEFESDQEREIILGLLEQLRTNAIGVLEGGGLPELPFELTLDGMAAEETPIGDWCAGFMEGVFLDEGAWFEGDEETVATLLLPFMALSGLFADEPDMADLAGEGERLERLVGQLPELVLDLYLHFRVPPDTPKPKPRGKAPAGGRGGKAGHKGPGNKGPGNKSQGNKGKGGQGRPQAKGPKGKR
ncbi:MULTISPECIES: YecA family protein [unclassified Halomonas]|uniref:YecA/YgfB family protein n=1 Tax=unclassified Halomonas TaxID=2609666 RepID=UPI0009FE3103|nr:YecA family protein [Halomonas sp. YLB-10]RQW71957.1 YecA family protein [Halomonas sp. YLB-10]